MKQRPIIFNGEMVRAILDGRKMQTRRVVAKQPTTDLPVSTVAVEDRGIGFAEGRVITQYCPYGQPGDLLYVREAFAQPYRRTDQHSGCIYRADGPEYMAIPKHQWGAEAGWKPSIHMPKWAARIWLEVTAVRVERVQDISEDDARAEGITDGGCLNCGEHEPCGCDDPAPDAVDAFIWLWNSINAKRGHGWDENPWVWVVSFKQVSAPTGGSDL